MYPYKIKPYKNNDINCLDTNSLSLHDVYLCIQKQFLRKKPVFIGHDFFLFV